MLVERAVDGFLLLNTPADHIEVPFPWSPSRPTARLKT
jgi:hypothetical protein